jgi:hypothetical protein
MSIGETALIPTAAAIANAVHGAVGVRTSLPVTAEKVLTRSSAVEAETRNIELEPETNIPMTRTRPARSASD